MPMYEYQCDACNGIFETIRKFSDPPLTECRLCGAEGVRKLLSAPAFRLKGGGWYETDFKSGNQRNVVQGDSDSGGKSDSAGASKSDGGSDSGKSDSGKSDSGKPGSGKSGAGSSGSNSSGSDAGSKQSDSGSKSGSAAAGRVAPAKPSTT